MSQLTVENLSKQYLDAEGVTLQILKNVSFSLAAGESLAVVGPSGSGKSTLLHILGTLDEPSSGTVRFDGEDPFVLEQKALAEFRNRRVGMIFQDHHLLPQLTVIENVLIPAVAHGKVTREDEQRANNLLQEVGLAERRTHFPAQLSGGERQRVAVARALLNRPLVLLADEPTGSLDRHTADVIGRLLVDLQKRENTILVTVTHSPALAEMMGRQAELLDGSLVS
jgi:lipoprotein-releasing system ATP-binding protein